MAITTTYNGIEYRSRLEARWAAFMQNIGWDIIYEPFDGDGYIPDFLVQGERPFLVEVKPAVTQKEYEAAVPKAESGLAKHWRHDILVVGAGPFPQRMGNSCSTTNSIYPTPTAGWLGSSSVKMSSPHWSSRTRHRGGTGTPPSGSHAAIAATSPSTTPRCPSVGGRAGACPVATTTSGRSPSKPCSPCGPTPATT